MAHIKVARRSMDVKEWIAIRVNWLNEQRMIAHYPLKGWEVQEARQTHENDYELIGDRHPIEDGDWFFTPDGTAFLYNTIELPEALKDREVWFQFKTASEMMIQINGEWVGGVDPNRDRIRIKKAEDTLETVQLYMEGYNRSKPDDERNAETSHLRGCRQQFNSGAFIEIDALVESAYYDAKLLMETIQCDYIEESLSQKIEESLHKALLAIPFEKVVGETTPSQLHEGIQTFKKILQETVYDEETAYHIGKVALVAHSHLDIAYYWRRIHTIQKNARTCLIQLNLMDEYPEFTYAHTQAYIYETLERNYPEIFERVKEKVQSGQFEVAGGMYVEPDCNLPSVESLVRQCFYGQRYFKETFDITINNCWLPDVFGNSWTLPQILRKSGMDYFVSNKMSTWNDTNRFPYNNFIWKGIDGTRINACVPPTHFISWNTPEQLIENWETFQEKTKVPETLNMFGYGDGGSGVTLEMLEYMERLNKIPSIPKSRHIRGDQYLKEAFEKTEQLDTWDGELYLEMHRGTFTTKGYIKKMNRLFETRLMVLEQLHTAAYLKTGDYPEEEIDACWKLLLINQFHDILPGTHIHPVEKDVRADYEAMEEKLHALEELALEKLKGTDGFLYNGLGFERQGPEFIESEVPLDLPKGHVQKGTFEDKDGYWLQPEIAIPALSAVSFDTSDDEEESRCVETSTTWFEWDGKTLDTPMYKVQLSASAVMTSLIKKEDGRELVSPHQGLNELHLFHDYPGVYDAWDIIANYDEKEDTFDIVEELHLVNQGAVYVEFEVVLKSSASQWRQRIRFFRESNAIDLDYHVDWHEKHRLAKVMFNFDILARQAGYDTSGGTIYRDTHKNTTWQKARFEVCMHKYADLYEPGNGVAILNNCKYGISCDESRMGVSLLRGTVRPDNESDMGEHRFTLRMVPHNRPLEEAGIIEKAWAMNTPLYSMQRIDKEAFIPYTGNGEMHIQSIKKKHGLNDGKTVIVRMTELHGKRGHMEIQSLGNIKQVWETDLLENAVTTERNMTFSKDSVRFDYKPFEIVTLAVETE